MLNKSIFPLHMVIPVEPVGKARPRFSRNGVYTPEKTKQAERNIMTFANQQMKGSDPTEKPVEMYIYFYRSIPKSLNGSHIKIVDREAMLAGDILPTQKPDVDNYCKLVMDSFNGVVFKDDSQVVKLIAEKAYSDDPRTEIKVDILA